MNHGAAAARRKDRRSTGTATSFSSTGLKSSIVEADAGRATSRSSSTPAASRPGWPSIRTGRSTSPTKARTSTASCGSRMDGTSEILVNDVRRHAAQRRQRPRLRPERRALLLGSVGLRSRQPDRRVLPLLPRRSAGADRHRADVPERRRAGRRRNARSTWPRPIGTESCGTPSWQMARWARGSTGRTPGRRRGRTGWRSTSHGNLYVAHYGGGRVDVFDRSGALIGEISVPGNNPTNVAFGGPENRTLVITEVETGSIYRVDSEVAGQPLNDGR